jgi:hypothetical protein
MASKADERWVKKLNKLGRDLDRAAAAIHPAARKEQLGPEIERYRALAKQGADHA